MRGKKKNQKPFPLDAPYPQPSVLPEDYEWIYCGKGKCNDCKSDNVKLYMTYDPIEEHYSFCCEKCQRYYY